MRRFGKTPPQPISGKDTNKNNRESPVGNDIKRDVWGQETLTM